MKKLKIVIIIASLLFLLPFIIYLLEFNGGLSDIVSNWGDFGSYIGGLVSAIFSFASFTMVVVIFFQNIEYRERDVFENRVIQYLNLMNDRFARIQCADGHNIIYKEDVFSKYNALSFEINRRLDKSNNNYSEANIFSVQRAFSQNAIREFIDLFLLTFNFICETKNQKEFLPLLATHLSEQQRMAISIYKHKEMRANKTLYNFLTSGYKEPIDGYIQIGERSDNFQETKHQNI